MTRFIKRQITSLINQFSTAHFRFPDIKNESRFPDIKNREKNDSKRRTKELNTKQITTIQKKGQKNKDKANSHTF